MLRAWRVRLRAGWGPTGSADITPLCSSPGNSGCLDVLRRGMPFFPPDRLMGRELTQGGRAATEPELCALLRHWACLCEQVQGSHAPSMSVACGCWQLPLRSWPRSCLFREPGFAAGPQSPSVPASGVRSQPTASGFGHLRPVRILQCQHSMTPSAPSLSALCAAANCTLRSVTLPILFQLSCGSCGRPR